MAHRLLRRATSTIRHFEHFSMRLTSSSSRRLFGDITSAAKQFPTQGFKLLNNVKYLEEENWDWYSPETFYPVRIGEVFRSRYQVLGKLGYGAHSTAWLGRDMHAQKYVALKICERNSLSAKREVGAFDRLNGLTTTHAGALLIRQLLDHFEIACTEGSHVCLVHEPLGMCLETFRQLLPDKRLPTNLLKAVLRHLLLALDCLHSEAGIIHTGDDIWTLSSSTYLLTTALDVQTRNIHLAIEDESILKDFENGEMCNPIARKIDGDRIIYESRGLRLPKKSGRPVLCDFGEARNGQTFYEDDIQPYVYRAPEVILGIPWSYQVDIWNVGVVVWDLFENKHLFEARNEDGEQSTEHHLAEMMAILGPPPIELLQRSVTSQLYFEADGTWKASVQIPDISLEASEENLVGDDKVLFLQFMRKMLQWAPGKRHSAEELLNDPWLK